MQEVDKDYVPKEGTLKDLEVDFKGLKYSSCSGFDSVGDIKNTYEEDYKDSNGVRAYIPSEPAYSATDMKLTIFLAHSPLKTTPTIAKTGRGNA